MVYIRNIAKICVVAIAGVTFIWMPADMTAQQRSSTVFSSIENPVIPKSMTFAGKTIDFDRVDMFERLDRELTSRHIPMAIPCWYLNAPTSISPNYSRF